MTTRFILRTPRRTRWPALPRKTPFSCGRLYQRRRLSTLMATAVAVIQAIALLLSGMPASAEQSHAFVTRSVPLTVAPRGAALAQLVPSTAVLVVQRNGKFAEVALEGWSTEGAESVFFAHPGSRVILATLNPAGEQARRLKESKKDDYGTLWRKVRLRGWVRGDALGDALAPLWTKARALYQKRCSSCHALRSPDKFTANQWPTILRPMAKRAALTGEQHALVLRYLQAHAKNH